VNEWRILGANSKTLNTSGKSVIEWAPVRHDPYDFVRSVSVKRRVRCSVKWIKVNRRGETSTLGPYDLRPRPNRPPLTKALKAQLG